MIDAENRTSTKIDGVTPPNVGATVVHCGLQVFTSCKPTPSLSYKRRRPAHAQGTRAHDSPAYTHPLTILALASIKNRSRDLGTSFPLPSCLYTPTTGTEGARNAALSGSLLD